jgi:23S rRNA pseudouridine1911/1915/1917 synthase
VGDAITLHEPPATPTETVAEDIALEVLYEDDDLIVINKPAGLVVHPAAGHWSGTLVNALLHHCHGLSGIGGEQRPGIVHRLDKETSGCLVAAKNDAAHQALARQFAGREVTKIYLALAAGKFPRLSGMIEAAIGRHPVQRKKMTVVPDGRGRPAKTGYRVLGEVPGGSLVECTLHTGRTHQIRVHLKHLGHPVLGDEVYGKRAGFVRQMLHAWRLGFAHPRTGERVNFESPVPPDFVEAGVSNTLS